MLSDEDEDDEETRGDVVITMGQYIDPLKLMEYCCGQDLEDLFEKSIMN